MYDSAGRLESVHSFSNKIPQGVWTYHRLDGTTNYSYTFTGDSGKKSVYKEYNAAGDTVTYSVNLNDNSQEIANTRTGWWRREPLSQSGAYTFIHKIGKITGGRHRGNGDGSKQI